MTKFVFFLHSAASSEPVWDNLCPLEPLAWVVNKTKSSRIPEEVSFVLGIEETGEGIMFLILNAYKNNQAEMEHSDQVKYKFSLARQDLTWSSP